MDTRLVAMGHGSESSSLVYTMQTASSATLPPRDGRHTCDSSFKEAVSRLNGRLLENSILMNMQRRPLNRSKGNPSDSLLPLLVELSRYVRSLVCLCAHVLQQTRRRALYGRAVHRIAVQMLLCRLRGALVDGVAEAFIALQTSSVKRFFEDLSTSEKLRWRAYFIRNMQLLADKRFAGFAQIVSATHSSERSVVVKEP